MLTHEPIEHYRSEGCVVVEWLLDADTLDDLDEFNRRVVHGEPTLVPRLAPAPVRIPLPRAVHQGSLYENQRTLGHRYFATADEPEPEPQSQSQTGPELESEHGAARERAAAAD